MKPIHLLVFSLAAVATPLAAQSAARGHPACSRDNAGLTLPPGFCALIVADSVGRSRHIAALPNGDLAVALDGADGGVLILHDADGDGRAETRHKFGPGGGTGIAAHGGFLYFGTNRAIMRWPWPAGTLEPSGAPDTIVSGLPAGSQHAAKNIAVGNDGALFVNIGAPSNSCQERDRTPGSPGRDPCPLLDSAGGIWRFDSARLHQSRTDGHRFATGLRNTVALTVDRGTGQLFGVVHGRDQLGDWSQYYDVNANAEKPAEEFYKLEDGGSYGWPYCYFDPDLKLKVLNPEYGGDGHTVGRCAQFRQPMLGFPAHWAPDGLLIYRGTQFPAPYRGGAFIAFHGSWNRAPLPQQGYDVVFVPLTNGAPSGEFRVFAEGFRGPSEGQAAHRPCGVAEGPDGSLYVSDDRAGRIYRILYVGP
jgi:glucose/arabinose dehydrogenase